MEGCEDDAGDGQHVKPWPPALFQRLEWHSPDVENDQKNHLKKKGKINQNTDPISHSGNKCKCRVEPLGHFYLLLLHLQYTSADFLSKITSEKTSTLSRVCNYTKVDSDSRPKPASLLQRLTVRQDATTKIYVEQNWPVFT